ncbi:hypothetical protein BIZ38_14700 [Pseudoalteromonas sp. BZK2]|uniref:hypothetical protein n=1 Tax=Pseudoalteromonas sp. BZK2 TaxID=1904458 RepID=UPI0016546AD7|nr:hypothetical protein [Pseudoalteromonas sp. BZK2]MBC7009704.1 hypothetical protein [Pseudoalteromonas sp. BZK2]
MYQHKQYAIFIFVILGWIGGFIALAWNLIGADIPLMVFSAILVLVAFLFHGLTIKVSDKTVSWAFGPGVFGKTVTFDEIESVRAVSNSFRHGIGLRITHDGWVYSVSGFSAVELAMKDGTHYRLGTNDQEGLLAALREHIAEPVTDASVDAEEVVEHI